MVWFSSSQTRVRYNERTMAIHTGQFASRFARNPGTRRNTELTLTPTSQHQLRSLITSVAAVAYLLVRRSRMALQWKHARTGEENKLPPLHLVDRPLASSASAVPYCACPMCFAFAHGLAASLSDEVNQSREKTCCRKGFERERLTIICKYVSFPCTS